MATLLLAVSTYKRFSWLMITTFAEYMFLKADTTDSKDREVFKVVSSKPSK